MYIDAVLGRLELLARLKGPQYWLGVLMTKKRLGMRAKHQVASRKR
jgi:hypothetical protein